jgi:hypothetical protein
LQCTKLFFFRRKRPSHEPWVLFRSVCGGFPVVVGVAGWVLVVVVVVLVVVGVGVVGLAVVVVLVVGFVVGWLLLFLLVLLVLVPQVLMYLRESHR